MNQITVKASPGVNVPREDNARRYITDAEPVTITLTAYYRRQMVAGDLTEVAPETAAAPQQPGSETQDNETAEASRGKSKR